MGKNGTRKMASRSKRRQPSATRNGKVQKAPAKSTHKPRVSERHQRQIDQIMDQFDFHAVTSDMAKGLWKGPSNDEELHEPIEAELRGHARELLTEMALAGRSNDFRYYSPFIVTVFAGRLGLIYALASWLCAE
jgi:hypothetical protein